MALVRVAAGHPWIRGCATMAGARWTLDTYYSLPRFCTYGETLLKQSDLSDVCLAHHRDSSLVQSFHNLGGRWRAISQPGTAVKSIVSLIDQYTSKWMSVVL